jgi:hypothetical protein
VLTNDPTPLINAISYISSHAVSELYLFPTLDVLRVLLDVSCKAGGQTVEMRFHKHWAEVVKREGSDVRPLKSWPDFYQSLHRPENAFNSILSIVGESSYVSFVLICDNCFFGKRNS